MIKSYYEYNQVNEGNLKDAAIISLISMTLLSSCRLFHHHKSKHHTKTTVEVEAQPEEIIDNYIPATPKTKIVSSEIVKNFGKLPWPTERALMYQKFGNHKQGHITTNNSGISLKTNENSKIRSVFPGKVTKIFDVCGETTIIITHNCNCYTVYSGFKKLAKHIKLGCDVNETTVLGYSKTEISFQIWKAKGTKASPIDPERVLVN